MTETETRGFILLVDDDPLVANSMSRLMRFAGFEVAMFLRPEEALAHLASGAPADVLVSDMHMPQMHGLELLRAVRAASHTLPIVFLSGSSADDDDAMRALELGAFGFLTKPVDRKKMSETLAEAVSWARTSRGPS